MSASTPPNRQELLRRLNRELRLMNAAGTFVSQVVADRLQISSHELESMDLLNLHGSMSASRLADLTGLTSGGVTRLIDRLERAGFVRRTPDPEDRRRVIIELVPAEVGARVVPHFVGMIRRNALLVERYSDAELAVILDFLERTVAEATDELQHLRATHEGD